MTIGEKIKALRHEQGVTQEKLARYLSITSQAVSKWENNTGNPDVTMIAPLCHFFGVSADELCGVESERIREIFEENDAKSVELYKAGRISDLLVHWREAAARFPRDYATLSRLTFALSVAAHGTEEREESERESLIAEAIALGERILADCTDEGVRSFVLNLLTAEYAVNPPPLGDRERALFLARTAPDFRGSSPWLLRYAAEDEERRRNAENLLTDCLWTAADLMKEEDFTRSDDEFRQRLRDWLAEVNRTAEEGGL